jgi:hypothetical protein
MVCIRGTSHVEIEFLCNEFLCNHYVNELTMFVKNLKKITTTNEHSSSVEDFHNSHSLV